MSGAREGEDFWLPPQTDVITRANPGTYTLKSGEVVVDPDYLTLWTITPPTN